ncbi:MAG TPA: molybdopterin-containing oxidoreductase catalytic subunit, partial [Kofleriaceae bacterium]|nr:molybdopterin-containing oxidoreductase catalytic subunit [Kofleriaceae bacterium]
MSERHPSACPLDCPDLCGVEVTVEDGRVVSLTGDRRGPITDGFICGKVRKITDYMYGKDRVLRPRVRVGARGAGDWREVSWEEALGLVSDRIA